MKRYILATFLLMCASLVLLQPSYSAAAPVAWGWDRGMSAFMSNLDYPGRDCSDRFIMAVIEGNGSNSRGICYSGSSDGMRIGKAVDGTGPVIGFGLDSKMYPLRGCAQVQCLYSPSQDMIITKQLRINAYVHSLVIYRNAQQRITHIDDPSGNNTIYSIDLSNPDYFYQNNAGYGWPIEAYGVSDNGRWLGIQLRSQGFAILDLNTMRMIRVSERSSLYELDQSIGIDVSDDGTVMAVAGRGTGLLIIPIKDGCGSVMDSNVLPYAHEDNLCTTIDVPMADLADAYFTSNPKLDRGGGQLSVTTHEYDSLVEGRTTIYAQGYRGSPLHYLGLGDSFSSGEGELSDVHYLAGTNERYDNCHTSDRSYPFLVGRLLGIDESSVKSVACSGAVMKDIIGAVDYAGQNNRLGVGKLALTGIDLVTKRIDAIGNVRPGILPQADLIERYRPAITTIGVGGNDSGFMGKLATCMTPNETCEWATTASARHKTAIEIAHLFDGLVATYTQIRSLSPSTQIYAVGYPAVFARDGRCSLLVSTLLDRDERTFANESIGYLNQVMSAAAEKAGVRYIDIEDSFGDAAVCGTGTNPAMNMVRLGEDVAPIASAGWLELIGQETFHPTPYGHELNSRIIADVIVDSRVADCTESCNTVMGAPQPPEYWTSDAPDDGRQTAGDFMESGFSGTAPLFTVQFSGLSFRPGSAIHIEIHSEPRAIDDLAAAEDGSLMATLRLPRDLPDGFHTVHVYGTSYSGEAIDVYQVIRYSRYSAMETVTSAAKDVLIGAAAAVGASISVPLAGELGINTESPGILGSTIKKLPAAIEGEIGEFFSSTQSLWWIAAMSIVGLLAGLVIVVRGRTI